MYMNIKKVGNEKAARLYKLLLHSNIPSSLLSLSNNEWNILPFFTFSCSLGHENCRNSAAFAMGSSYAAVLNASAARSEGLMVTGILGLCFLNSVKEKDIQIRDVGCLLGILKLGTNVRDIIFPNSDHLIYRVACSP